MMHDKQGRSWATVTSTKAGSVVIPDGGFDCLNKGQPYTVEEDKQGLFVRCSQRYHYLEGQLDFETGTFYVGLYSCP